MFYGALRLAEILPPTIKAFDPTRHLTRADVWTSDHKLHIRIKHAKNLQLYNQSRVIVLAQSPELALCPVRAVQKVLTTSPTVEPIQPMFVFPQSTRPLPASYARKNWGTVVKSLAMDPSKHTMHSIQKTAATTAYHKGCKEHQIQHFGGWASKAYQTYI